MHMKSGGSNSTKRRCAALEDMSDEELMFHLQEGVEEAFEILREKWNGKLYSFVYKFIGDKATTEDILQEAWIRVFRNRHSYSCVARFSTWLYTIAGNLARSEYRRRQRTSKWGMGPIQGMNKDGDEYDYHIAVDTPSPSYDVDMDMRMKTLDIAFKMLSEDFREVIIFRIVQQLSYNEIAEITGLPMGTVKSRINRGRIKLQEILTELLGDSPHYTE